MNFDQMMDGLAVKIKVAANKEAKRLVRDEFVNLLSGEWSDKEVAGLLDRLRARSVPRDAFGSGEGWSGDMDLLLVYLVGELLKRGDVRVRLSTVDADGNETRLTELGKPTDVSAEENEIHLSFNDTFIDLVVR